MASPPLFIILLFYRFLTNIRMQIERFVVTGVENPSHIKSVEKVNEN